MIPGTIPMQSGVSEVGGILCDYGFGQLITIGLAALALYLIFKGIFQVLYGFDDLYSPRQQDQQAGREKVTAGAKKIVIGAFGPSLIAALFELIGISTISCFDFNIGILSATLMMPV